MHICAAQVITARLQVETHFQMSHQQQKSHCAVCVSTCAFPWQVRFVSRRLCSWWVWWHCVAQEAGRTCGWGGCCSNDRLTCSMVSVVSTPKMVGTPVDLLTSSTPFVAPPATAS